MREWKKLKRRTIFNLLGPLTNPASTSKQLLGVFDKNYVNLHWKVVKNVANTRYLTLDVVLEEILDISKVLLQRYMDTIYQR